MAKAFVITGPSGVGKGTLIAKLLERVPDLELSISATTREPREGEVDGRDYHFLSLEEFDRRIAAEEFIEFATYSGNRYGTLRSEVRHRLDEGHSVVLEIEVQGARQVRAAMRESVQVFIAPPDPAQPTASRRSTPGSRWPSRSWPPRTSSPTASSTTSSSERPASWRESCAPSSAYH
jgi:guanylate kinase